MRSTTAGELAVLAANNRVVTWRVKVENGSGTMIDLTSWVHHIAWDLDVDQPVSGATVYFVRSSGSTQSLSPLRTDSTLNLKDDHVTISAQLKAGRKITIESTTTAVGATIVSGDYKLGFEGEIDAVNFEDNPVSVSCRDKGGLLVDRWVGANWSAYQAFKIYGTTTGSGTVAASFGHATFSTSQAGVIHDGDTIVVNNVQYVISSFDGTTHALLIPGGRTFAASAFEIDGKALEDVMQEILDDAILASPIPISVPLNVIGTPGFTVTQYKQENQSVMEAMQALAMGTIAWDARYIFDSASGTFKFTLWEPDRTKTTPDYTFGPSQYFTVNRLNIDRTLIRNQIVEEYYDTAAKQRKQVTASDAISQSEYGLRYMLSQEPDNSPINTLTEASNKVNAILADLKDPKAEQEITLPFFWPAELGDLYRHSANGVHYNSNQDFAVVRIEHEMGVDDGGGRPYARTTLRTRGSVAGAYVNHFKPRAPSPSPEIPRLIAPTGEVLFDVDTPSLSLDPHAMPSRFRCELTNSISTNPSITTGTATAIPWDTENFDFGSLHDLATNNTRITVPADGDTGVWLFTGVVQWDTNTVSYREISVRKNGTTTLRTVNDVPHANGLKHEVVAWDNAPSVGDYYELVVTQFSGSNRLVSGNGSYFSAVHLW